MRHSLQTITHNILTQCQSLNHLLQAQSLLIKTNLISHPQLLTTLITLSSLSHFSNLPHALSLLTSSSLNLHSSHLYTTLIRAYSYSILPITSIHLYNQMCHLSLPPTPHTFPFVLRACSRIPLIELEANPILFLSKGSELHCRVVRVGIDSDVYIRNSLITMYANCGRIDRARQVFDEMCEKSVVTWNAMVAAYSRCGEFVAADEILLRMPEKNVASWNGVITRNVRLGDVMAARRVFDTMPERDSVSWNAMIAGYIRMKDYGTAIGLFKMMLAEFEPTELTLVSVLGACAETGSMAMGREIHNYLKSREVSIDGFVGNALLDMYAKSGNVKLARQVFDEMGSTKHVSCWNSMIVAMAVHGFCDEALELFAKMDQKPNRVTFLGVLLAYSHKGLVNKGREFFQRMIEEYKIKPDIKHYGCMVDMFCRMGFVDDAYKLIKEMPMKATSVIWKTLLGACKVHGGVEVAEEAFSELGAAGPLTDDDYVLMSNIYAEAERWDDVERLRCGMIGQNSSKKVGRSQIELN